jgi:hypothetical protein
MSARYWTRAGRLNKRSSESWDWQCCLRTATIILRKSSAFQFDNAKVGGFYSPEEYFSKQRSRSLA